MAKYPYLVQQHHKWIVRMVIPADVRSVIGQSVFKVSTGEGDRHRAAEKSLTIIAGLKRRIDTARATLESSEKTQAGILASRYREIHGAEAARFVLEDVVQFVLKEGGHSLTDYGRRLKAAGGVVEEALDEASLARLEMIIGEATPFLKHVDAWKPHANLKPRPLDQAISSLKSFDAAVRLPIEKIEAKHVQAWIDAMINPNGDSGLKAVTVARKMGEVRNYWKYLQSVQIVPEDRDPFANRRIKEPPTRKETRDEKRQKWLPSQVVQLWERTASPDPQLHAAIKIAAYSGARIEGVAQLKVSDIRFDPVTRIRFMHMADKTAAGDRDVPIHPEINTLIDGLIERADPEGYLIHSDAKNKYGERSQPLGKRFGRLKTALGFDGRYVFHSLRKTVSSMMQDAGVTENVAADIVGHVKPGMTFGLYGGITSMDLRAKELFRSVCYPSLRDEETGEKE